MVNIIEPYAHLVGVADPTSMFTREDGINCLRRIEYFGRVSHRSENAQTEGSWERFIRTVVLGHGDWSIVEHATVTVDAIIDRGIQQEWTRHRLFSYTIESTRFVNYEKKMEPSFINPGLSNFDVGREDIWNEAIEGCEKAYKKLVSLGTAPQIARSVFPLALASRCMITSNLRNWRHLLLMRTTKETHPQFRQVSIPLLQEFQEKIPIIFEDIEPLAKQSDNLKKMR